MARSTRPPRRQMTLQPAAGNGLLDRRTLIGRSVLFAGAMGAGVPSSFASAAAEPLANNPGASHPAFPFLHMDSRHGTRQRLFVP
jgi:hypothetical protein